MIFKLYKLKKKIIVFSKHLQCFVLFIFYKHQITKFTKSIANFEEKKNIQKVKTKKIVFEIKFCMFEIRNILSCS